MQHIYQMVRQVAKTRTNILITGESGTGKELIARAIHDKANGPTSPSCPSTAAAFPKTWWKANFSATRKGAFTGATQDKAGLLEVAHGGTLFLDEVGELGIPMQVKLLRAVQERTFRPWAAPATPAWTSASSRPPTSIWRTR
jgi:two-component system, NtrC family, response regulator PilR